MELFDAPVSCRRCGGDGTVQQGTALCPTCNGDGITTETRPIPMQDCPACHGKGYVIETRELPDDRYEHRTDPCTNCNQETGKR